MAATARAQSYVLKCGADPIAWLAALGGPPPSLVPAWPPPGFCAVVVRQFIGAGPSLVVADPVVACTRARMVELSGVEAEAKKLYFYPPIRRLIEACVGLRLEDFRQDG